jgi:hypothetical protein
MLPLKVYLIYMAFDALTLVLFGAGRVSAGAFTFSQGPA